MMSYDEWCENRYKVLMYIVLIKKIPVGVIGIFYWHNPLFCAMSVGSSRPPTEMNTRNFSWGVKPADVLGWPYLLNVLTVLKSGNLHLLEPSEPVQACNWVALLLFLFFYNFSDLRTDAVCCVFIHIRNKRNIKFDFGIISLEENLMSDDCSRQIA